MYSFLFLFFLMVYKYTYTYKQKSCGYLKLNVLSRSFAIYNILNNMGKWQNLNGEKISVGRKTI